MDQKKSRRFGKSKKSKEHAEDVEPVESPAASPESSKLHGSDTPHEVSPRSKKSKSSKRPSESGTGVESSPSSGKHRHHELTHQEEHETESASPQGISPTSSDLHLSTQAAGKLRKFFGEDDVLEDGSKSIFAPQPRHVNEFKLRRKFGDAVPVTTVNSASPAETASPSPEELRLKRAAHSHVKVSRFFGAGTSSVAELTQQDTAQTAPASQPSNVDVKKLIKFFGALVDVTKSGFGSSKSHAKLARDDSALTTSMEKMRESPVRQRRGMSDPTDSEGSNGSLKLSSEMRDQGATSDAPGSEKKSVNRNRGVSKSSVDSETVSTAPGSSDRQELTSSSPMTKETPPSSVTLDENSTPEPNREEQLRREQIRIAQSEKKLRQVLGENLTEEDAIGCQIAPQPESVNWIKLHKHLGVGEVDSTAILTDKKGRRLSQAGSPTSPSLRHWTDYGPALEDVEETALEQSASEVSDASSG